MRAPYSSARDVERPILSEARCHAGRDRRNAPGGCHLELAGGDVLRLSQWRQGYGSYASSLFTIGVASLWNGHRHGLFKFRDGEARHLPRAITCGHQVWQGDSMTSSKERLRRVIFMLGLIVAAEAIFGLPFHIARFFRPILLAV